MVCPILEMLAQLRTDTSINIWVIIWLSYNKLFLYKSSSQNTILYHS